MTVTTHGEKRLRKRKGISKANVEQDFKLALAEGLRHKDMKGQLKKWAGWMMREYQSNCVYYQNFIYFFRNDILITTYPLPQRFRKYL